MAKVKSKIKETIEKEKIKKPASVKKLEQFTEYIKSHQLGKLTKQALIREAFGTTDYPIAGEIDSDDWQYRKLNTTRKDLPQHTQDRHLRIAFYLYMSNPLANRIIETTTDFVMGTGLTYEAETDEVQNVLDEFWNDPVNNLEEKQRNKITEMNLYGEGCFPTFVNPMNGLVRLGYIDPLNIVRVLTNPNNIEEQIAIKYKTGFDVSMTQTVTRKLVRVDEDITSKTYGLRMGECFYFAVNKLSNMTRGRSDLLTLIDWLDGYDLFLFDVLERGQFLNSFIWDVMLKGMNEAEINEWVKKQQVPKPGSIRAHNENAEWQALAPDLKSADMSGVINLVLSQIFGGAGLPPHWYSIGSKTNRASVEEMGVPVVKRLMTRQIQIKNMFKNIFNYVIDQKVAAGMLKTKDGKPIENKKFKAVLPSIFEKETINWINNLSSITFALQTGLQNGWMTMPQAQVIYQNLVGMLGVDIPEDKEGLKAMTTKVFTPVNTQPIGGQIPNIPQAPAPYPMNVKKSAVEEATKLCSILSQLKYQGVMNQEQFKKLSDKILESLSNAITLEDKKNE